MVSLFIVSLATRRRIVNTPVGVGRGPAPLIVKNESTGVSPSYAVTRAGVLRLTSSQWPPKSSVRSGTNTASLGTKSPLPVRYQAEPASPFTAPVRLSHVLGFN